MKKNFHNEGLIAVAAILWGVISLFSKPLMNMGFDSMQVVFFRALISAGLLAIFILIYDRSLFKIKLKDIPIFIGSGVLGFSFCVYCYMGSIDQNGAGVAAMLMYSSPVWVVIISRFLFNEKINIFKIIALIGVLVGCVMVSLGGELNITLIGAILGVGSGVGFALISIFSKLSANKGFNPLTAQFYTFIFAIIASFPIARAWKMPDMIATDYNCLLYFFLVSLISTTLPYVLYNLALKKVSASTAGILSSLEVVVGAITGFIAYKENIGIVGVFGIVIMFAALVLIALKGNELKIDKIISNDIYVKDENKKI